MSNKKLYIANFNFEVISIDVEGKPMFFAYCVAGAPKSLCAEASNMRALGKTLKLISEDYTKYIIENKQAEQLIKDGYWEISKNKNPETSFVAKVVKGLSNCPRVVLVSGFAYA